MNANIVDLNTTVDGATCHAYVSLEVPEDDASFSERFLERVRLNMPEYLAQKEDFFDKKK